MGKHQARCPARRLPGGRPISVNLEDFLNAMRRLYRTISVWKAADVVKFGNKSHYKLLVTPDESLVLRIHRVHAIQGHWRKGKSSPTRPTSASPSRGLGFWITAGTGSWQRGHSLHPQKLFIHAEAGIHIPPVFCQLEIACLPWALQARRGRTYHGESSSPQAPEGAGRPHVLHQPKDDVCPARRTGVGPSDELGRQVPAMALHTKKV